MRKLRLDEPVVVLTCARSGSTLLRVLLDSHPELACPPETNLLDLCTRMGVLSMFLEGPAVQARHKPTSLAMNSIRSFVRVNYGAYLIQAGKARWCDKSLGSAESADRFLSLFPKAKFICLYRHCMDVIDSIHEACPWGLTGYGLDPFGIAHPGNSVAAVADYWASHTKMILEFENLRPQACLRLRYEDLVSDPQVHADRVFAFAGEACLPTVGSALDQLNPDRFGAADHKIWETGGFHDDSVGRGSRIPAGAIPPAVLNVINELLAQLGYVEVTEDWGAAQPDGMVNAWDPGHGPDAADRDGPAARDSRGAAAAAAAVTTLDALEGLLATHIAARVSAAGPAAAVSGKPFALAASVPMLDGTGTGTRVWQVDPALGTMARTCGATAGSTAGTAGWQADGLAATWVSVVTGQLAVATALRHGLLRVVAPQGRGGRDGTVTGARGQADDDAPEPVMTDDPFPDATRALADIPSLGLLFGRRGRASAGPGSPADVRAPLPTLRAPDRG